MSELGVSSSTVRSIFNHLLENGAIREVVENDTGILFDDLNDQDLMVSLPKYHQFWQYAVRITNDPAIGLKAGERIDPSQIGIIGQIVINSSTLREGLEQYVRLVHLAHGGVDARFEVDKKTSSLIFEAKDAEYCIQDMERMLSLTICRARKFVHERVSLVKVVFAHSEQPYGDEYKRIFKCPLEFDGENCAIVFDNEFLDYKLKERNPYLHQALMSSIQGKIKKFLNRKSFSAKVKKVISDQIVQGNVDADLASSQLAMSRQTLYRKLKQEHHTFQSIVEEVRKEKAMEYLEDEKYGLSEIAFMLGFSELSAFSRAFKRWTGKSPREYKKGG